MWGAASQMNTFTSWRNDPTSFSPTLDSQTTSVWSTRPMGSEERFKFILIFLTQSLITSWPFVCMNSNGCVESGKSRINYSSYWSPVWIRPLPSPKVPSLVSSLISHSLVGYKLFQIVRAVHLLVQKTKTKYL